MSEEFTREEAISRYGELMMSYGRLQEQERIVSAAGVYAEFHDSANLLARARTYRELTGKHYPDLLEIVNKDMWELEGFCRRLVGASDEPDVPF